jgi:radical SAM protein with 4Fe4S-binding SPASM domain
MENNLPQIEKVLIWMEEVQFVSGYYRSVLLDLPRNKSYFVDVKFDLFIEKIRNTHSPKNWSDIEQDWLNWCFRMDFAMTIPINHKDCFVPLRFDYLEHRFVNNIICSLKHLKTFLKLDTDFGLLPIAVVHDDLKVNSEQIMRFISKVMNYANIREMLFFGSENDFAYKDLVIKYNVDFSIHKLNQTVNITLFTESQAHHTYFNRKLYIGPNGEIKNAPECPETFGYIQDLESPEELKAIVQTPEFQKYWFVHKEITDVCKDCEFRHMCVDNRLPHQRAENEWFHQTECNYNPYIAKWKGEEGYRTLAECGVISNENEFSIDHEKIAEINKELWGEE